MYVKVTALRYWKSEHTAQSCQDWAGYSSQRGIFVVADGVGTTSFSEIWSRVLGEQFIKVPLMSEDPYEVEWWVRQVQPIYEKNVPAIESLPAYAQDKAREGSQSTLATLRVSEIKEGRVQVELLAFGDSCILVEQPPSSEIHSFFLSEAEQFDQSPICVPSKLKVFKRDFHRCQTLSQWIEPGQIVLLATDAVARWIIGRGRGARESQHSTFSQVASQTPPSWKVFIDGLRGKEEIVDDDSTVLVLRFSAEGGTEYEPLGSTPYYDEETIKERRAALAAALEARDQEQISVLVGDQQTVGNELPEDVVRHARAVGDALAEVKRAFQAALNDPTRSLPERLAPVWQSHAPLLADEPSAANLRASLIRYGVIRPNEPGQGRSQTRNPALSSSDNLRVVTEPSPKDAAPPPGEHLSPPPDPPPLWAALSEEKKGKFDGFREAVREAKFHAVSALYDDAFGAAQQVAQQVDQAAKQTVKAANALWGAPSAADLLAAYHWYETCFDQFVRTCGEFLGGTLSIPVAQARNQLDPELQARIAKVAGEQEWAERIERALGNEDEQAIVEAYEAYHAAGHSLTTEQQERLAVARCRVETLPTFQAACRQRRADDIVKAYQPCLEGYRSLSEEDRACLEAARKFVEMHEQMLVLRQSHKQTPGISRDEFLKKVVLVVAGYDGPARSQFDDLDDTSKQIIDKALDYQAEQLRSYREAKEADDDRAIAQVSLDVLKSSPDFQPADMERYEITRKRSFALGPLNRALGQHDAKQIVAAYDPILDGSTLLEPAVLARIEHAKRHVEALTRIHAALESEDEHAIVAASAYLDHLPPSALTSEELAQIEPLLFRLSWRWALRCVMSSKLFEQAKADKKRLNKIAQLVEDYNAMEEKPKLTEEEAEALQRYQALAAKTWPWER